MQEFAFDINSPNRKRHTVSRVLGWSTTGVLTLVAIVSLNSTVPTRFGVSSDLDLLVFDIAALGAIICLSILARSEALRYAGRQMVFILDDNQIVRKRRGYPDLRIPFAEIDYLREEQGWLVIRSTDKQTRLVVPYDIGGYDVIRAELTKHHPISPQAEVSWTGTVISVVSLVSWVVVLWFREVRVIIVAGIIAILTLAIGSFQLRRLLRKRRRLILWSCLAVMWCSAVILIYVRLMQQ